MTHETNGIADYCASSLANHSPSTIWSVLEVLRRPQLREDIAKLISHYRPSQGATYNIKGIADLRLIQSVQAEVLRLRLRTALVRIGNVQSFALDEKWLIPPETSILAFSKDIKLDVETWTKAQPDIINRPLNEFYAERFITSRRTVKNTALTSTTDDLNKIISVGGEHPHYHLGVQYTRDMFAATLAAVFGDFELELCDPEAFDAVIEPEEEGAYGTAKPFNQIAVRIRKRQSL